MNTRSAALLGAAIYDCRTLHLIGSVFYFSLDDVTCSTWLIYTGLPNKNRLSLQQLYSDILHHISCHVGGLMVHNIGEVFIILTILLRSSLS